MSEDSHMLSEAERQELVRVLQDGKPVKALLFGAGQYRNLSFYALGTRLEARIAWPEEAEDLPADLLAVLRDPSITIQRDHEIRLADGRTLAEHMQEWRNAPSNTASAD